MLSRRQFAAAICMALFAADNCPADEADWQTALRKTMASQSPITLGHKLPPADDIVWTEAHAILAGAPVGVSPYRVAEYFISSVPPKYQRAWPEPDYTHPTLANPVIVLFFVATHTQPSGDQTAWCAAFVNWCLAKSGIRGTNDPSSQSFIKQKWGTEVWNKTQGTMPSIAKRGDIAIFRHKSDPVHGHVCFFTQVSKGYDRRIDVLGGNQIRGAGPNRIHLIDSVAMKVFGSDTDLELISIRTAPGLREV
jgi:uncharacterized protein (TIGR02594 family)